MIGLDDLLSDFYKEKSKLIDRGNRKRKASSKLYDSDDDERGQEALLSIIVDDCRNQAWIFVKFHQSHSFFSLFLSYNISACFQMNEICSEEDTQEWGLCLFGDQVRGLFYSNVIDIVC